MASSLQSADVWEWLVIIPDKPGSKEKRLAARPAHLKNIMAVAESKTDTWKMGGILLNDLPGAAAPTDPSGWDFHGSTMVIKAKSREDIIGALSEDVYVKEGVWDLERVQAWPLKAAFRIP